MKQITMLLAIPFLLASLSPDAKAGNGRLSVGAEIAAPMGDFANGANTGYGGSIRYELPVGSSCDVTLTAGYITFSGKDLYDGTTLTQIPIQAGLKAYFKEDQAGLYIHVMLGDCISSTDATGAETKANFCWAPEMGYHFAHIDLGLRYQIITTEKIFNTTLIGLRAAYVFGSK